MSDNLSPVAKIKFSEKLEFCDKSPNLSRSFIEHDKILVSINVSSVFLSELYKAKGENSDLSYLAILNTQITGFQLSSTRLEERLKALSYKVHNLYRKKCKNGNHRRNLNEKRHTIAIYESELLDVINLNVRLSNFEKKNIILDKKCRKLYDQLQTEIKARLMYEKKTEKNIAEIASLTDSVNSHCVFKNVGKSFNELSSRSQKSVILQQFQSDCEKALWFAESYGLIPSMLKFRSTTDDKFFNVDLETKHPSNFDQLSINDKRKLQELVYILDRFAVSDRAYHELSMKQTDFLIKIVFARHEKK